ncbi:flagellar filament capping protein FliD [Alteribacillus iranensis]|uniref:Flagellar hook-associated protein 2 n=1 Tax=Alteribacillus iranensis TaxID=930128 RepID=A0A1I2EIE9_9BACI|nr:flagellar filament capping protein FliD [Alteribacillus iranensis]SFE92874.1 flagellar hook-associated protein 2 [Alteribacillus iranensis]
MRLSGFASGMDIEQIVGDLMRAERMPMDKMVQKRQTIEWQMEEYRSVNRLFESFRNNIFDSVMRRSNMGARTGSSSNEDRVSVTASATASNANYRVSSVEQLATAASQTSGSLEGLPPNEELYSVTSSTMWKTGKVQKETIQGEDTNTYKIQSEGSAIIDDIDNMVIKVNGELYEPEDGEVEIKDDEITLHFNEALGINDKVSVTYFTEDAEENSYYMSGDVTTYDKDGNAVRDRIIVQGNQTMQDVLQSINRSSVGVSGFYDEHTSQIAFTRSETGDFNQNGNEMVFEGTLFNELINMYNSTGDPVEEREGKNAIFTVNGLRTERHSNTFTIDGMTITLKETFDANEDEAVTIGSSIDTDTVYETIKGFVDEYNEMLDTINEKLGEKRHRDYPPLTDDQKKELSDREIELWEEKAKSGLVRNDRLLSGFMNTFRLDLYGAVQHNYETDFKQLTTIGITTTRNYMDRGKLEIDETKLKDAIEADPDAMYQLFAADGESREEQGIARRLRNSLDQAIEGVAERAGGAKGKIQNHQFTLGRNLNNIEDQITDFERRLTDIENRYWRQFTAMEKAMARANEQASFLQQQMLGNGS